MRLIDADALMDKVNNTFAPFVTLLSDAPTVDAEPVVHCADCIHRHEDGYCDSPVGNVGYSRVDDDDFCSCGFRKKNEPSDGR